MSIVSPLVANTAHSKDRLQEHLDRLLGVEADYAIRDFSVGNQACRVGVSPGALKKTSRYLLRLRHPEGPCLPEARRESRCRALPPMPSPSSSL